ncbi:thiosulfate dehydrogenase [quinone] large subunit [Metabacillus crassostreae]|nr:thiosulfate dehydrogenase [quinone] large subunit [Metabacillus crassostreae]
MMNIIKGPKMAIIWTILRVWLGVQWLKAGIPKVTGEFDATGYLQGAIANASGDHPAVQGWYATFLEQFALPNAGLFNILIPWGEVLVGVGLIVGAATLPALIAAGFMNLNFLLAGTVSTNPILYTAAMILIGVGTASYFYGVDRILLPYVKMKIEQRREKNKNDHTHKHLPVH